MGGKTKKKENVLYHSVSPPLYNAALWKKRAVPFLRTCLHLVQPLISACKCLNEMKIVYGKSQQQHVAKLPDSSWLDKVRHLQDVGSTEGLES